MAGLGPGRRNENVVVVGIAINDAAPKVWDAREGFVFEEMEEISGEGAAFGIFDVSKKLARPEGSREIPFKLAFGEGVREIEERGVDFGEETAETFEKLEGMRIGLDKDCAGKKGEKPDEARGAIGQLSLSEELAR